jgi:multiple sugar transport system substrate-binding protein
MTKRLDPLFFGGAFLAALLLAGSAQAGTNQIVLHALMEDVPETQIIETMLPEFEKTTGIKVQFQRLAYSDMHDKLVAQLTGSRSFYNVIEVDFLWAGEFPEAGWLADLTPFVKASGFDLKPMMRSMMDLVGEHEGVLRMIPMYNYSMGLIYRTDILADPNLQAAYKLMTGKVLTFPATLEDYVRISQFMDANTAIAGAAMQGQSGDPNSMEFSNYLFSVGGGYLDDNGNVILDSAEGLKALELYVANITSGAQKGVSSATLDDTFRLMCDGKAWSMVTYWWMLAQIDDGAKCPNVAGKLALAVMPGGHGESGGWGWAIPKNESPEEQDAAWKFIEWVQGSKLDRTSDAGTCAGTQ